MEPFGGKSRREMLSVDLRCLGWCDVVGPKQAKVQLGIIVPVDGIFVRFPVSMVQRIRNATLEFFQRRTYRRCADLARPL